MSDCGVRIDEPTRHPQSEIPNPTPSSSTKCPHSTSPLAAPSTIHSASSKSPACSTCRSPRKRRSASRPTSRTQTKTGKSASSSAHPAAAKARSRAAPLRHKMYTRRRLADRSRRRRLLRRTLGAARRRTVHRRRLRLAAIVDQAVSRAEQRRTLSLRPGAGAGSRAQLSDAGVRDQELIGLAPAAQIRIPSSSSTNSPASSIATSPRSARPRSPKESAAATCRAASSP